MSNKEIYIIENEIIAQAKKTRILEYWHWS